MKKTHEIYLIRLKGHLDPAWSDWLSGWKIKISKGNIPTTSLIGPVRDQSELRGIANKLWDLNMSLISIICVDYFDSKTVEKLLG